MMQQHGRHEPQAERWPSFLGDPPAAAPTYDHAAQPQPPGAGFQLPMPPQFAQPQQPPAPPQQFQYAPAPHAHPTHQPAGHAPGYGAPAFDQQASHEMYAAAQQPMQSPYAPQTYQHGAAAIALPATTPAPTFVAADGRTYAYATPQGFDLMQGALAHAGVVAAASAAAAPAPSGAQRLRWETIIPAMAAVLLLCTVVLFVLKFDAITGRDQLAKSTKPAATTKVPAPSAEDQAASLEQARSLTNLGRYDEAKAMVDPLLAVKEPLDGVAALSSQIETSSARNDELLAQLGKQRQAGSWMGVVTTIGQIKALRPLTTDLVTIRNNAQARVNAAQRTKKRARVAAAARRTAAAKRRRAAKARSTQRTAPRPNTRPGATRSTSAATPPARVGSGAMPPRPSVANTGAAPTGGGVTGTQPAVTGGGGGSSCHTHGGVSECH